MENDHHIKSYNTDKRSTKRLRFTSAKERAKQASADVYRSYKRRVGVVTSAASREERVHHPEQYGDYIGVGSAKKKRRTQTVASASSREDNRSVILRTTPLLLEQDDDDASDGDGDVSKSTFAEELELTHDRNASRLFTQLHRELSPLVESLPEILHNVEHIIRLLCSYLLSPYDTPTVSSPDKLWRMDDDGDNAEDEQQTMGEESGTKRRRTKRRKRERFVVNLVTTDVLHLISVLARDLRHEIHPFLHRWIMPRIINDLINPPTTATKITTTITIGAGAARGESDTADTHPTPAAPATDDTNHNQNTMMKQRRMLDVTIVETAFRTLSYIFRYDTSIMNPSPSPSPSPAQQQSKKSKKKKKKQTINGGGGNCLESMRQYYGTTLTHRQEYVRRLAAETFAPLLRRLRSPTDRKRHVRRVMKALATASTSSLSSSACARVATSNDLSNTAATTATATATGGSILEKSMERTRDDAIDGVSLLLFYTVRGVPGRLHSKGEDVIRAVLECLQSSSSSSSIATEGKKKGDGKSSRASSSSTTGDDTEMTDDDGWEEKRRKERAEGHVLYRVVAEFMGRVRYHCNNNVANFDKVWDVLYPSVEGAIDKVLAIDGSNGNTDVVSRHSRAVDSLGRIVQVMTTCVSYRDGHLLTTSTDGDDMNPMKDRHAERLSSILKRLLEQMNVDNEKDDEVNSIITLTSKNNNHIQGPILDLLCSSWKVFPDNAAFASRISRLLSTLISTTTDNHPAPIESNQNQQRQNNPPALVLAKDLLPYLPGDIALRSLVPVILKSAAEMARCGDRYGSLIVLHSVSTARLRKCRLNDDDDDDDGDSDDDEDVTTLDDDDGLFFTGHSICCSISTSDKEALVGACLIDASSDLGTIEGSDLTISQLLGYVSRCIPFIAYLECDKDEDNNDDDEDDEEEKMNDKRSTTNDSSSLTKIGKWIIKMISTLDTTKRSSSSNENNNTNIDTTVIQALLLESLAHTTLRQLQASSHTNVTNKKTTTLLKTAKTPTTKLLFQNPTSISVVRAVAAMGTVFQEIGIPPSSWIVDKTIDDVFEVLNPNLRSSNHFLRLHTLRVLNLFPKRPFLVDHADLDLGGDLDEEPSFRPPVMDDDEDGEDTNRSSTKQKTGMCNLLTVLLQIETTPIDLQNERTITSLINRIEILARSYGNKLPIVYTEAAAHHMFGILYIKYKPVWEGAMKALVALVGNGGGSGGVDCVWGCLEKMLERVRMASSFESVVVTLPEITNVGTNDDNKDANNNAEQTIQTHHKRILDYETSNGCNVTLYAERLQSVKKDGRVSRHQITDEMTVFELVWSVLERTAAQIVTSKSKVIVPMFLAFLYEEYYVFHDDDPDAREFGLEEHLSSLQHGDGNGRTNEKWSRNNDDNNENDNKLGRKMLQRKLISFLKTFSAVNGMKQLYKHQLLLSIFISFLSNPDVSIAQNAMSCILKFKLSYVTPYKDSIKGLLEKGNIRDALTQFSLSSNKDAIDNGGVIIEAQDRSELFPLIIRILFGRLTVRGGSGNGGGSSHAKDSPAARRAAIISFTNGLNRGNDDDKDDGGMDYFIYMMVRSFIPKSVDMTFGELGHNCRNHLRQLLHTSSSSSSNSNDNVKTVQMTIEYCTMTVQSQRQEGFLNLLSDVIKKIGFGVERYVPIFMNLLLSLVRNAELSRKKNPLVLKKEITAPIIVNEEETQSYSSSSDEDDAAAAAAAADDDDDDDDTDDEEAIVMVQSQNIITTNNNQTNNNHRAGRIRNLCFKRISELLLQFASSYDFTTLFHHTLWSTVQPALLNLPVSVMYAEKSPSLLKLLVSLSSHPKLLPLLCSCSSAVEMVFQCISGTSRFAVMDNALTFVDNLLTEGQSFEKNEETTITREMIKSRPGLGLVYRNVDLLIGQFTERLESGTASEATATNNDSDRQRRDQIEKRLAWQELAILSRVSELLVLKNNTNHDSATEQQHQQDTMEQLCKLLMPYLRFDKKITESSQSDVLGILSSILPRIRTTTAMTHFQGLSKLLGPNKASAGITSLDIRQKVVGCLERIAHHNTKGEEATKMASTTLLLKPVTSALRSLCGSNTKHVDEWDFDKLLPILNGLGNTESSENLWVRFASSNTNDDNVTKLDLSVDFDGVKALIPLLYTCLHLLYDSDGVLNRCAFKALHSLVLISSSQDAKATQSQLDEGASSIGTRSGNSSSSSWLRLIETVLVPGLKVGIGTRTASVRRSFIRLLAEVSKGFSSHDSPHLYGDLNCLIRSDDEEELDFFLNITHIQIHRRARALSRLRKLLSITVSSSSEDGTIAPASCPFSIQSLSNVLLPLAMHPIYDSNAKEEETYALEAIATVGAIAKHLPWGKYQSTLSKILVQLPRFTGQEHYLVAMICSLIDAFHFDVVITGNEEDGGGGGESSQPPSSSVVVPKKKDSEERKGNAIWKQLQKVIPRIEGLLVKAGNGRDVGKSLRSPIALALVKLFKKLPIDIFEAKLPRLLAVICDALKNKESDVRDVARATLSKIAASIDVKYISDIVRELAVTLKEGYQLHVRSATLHSVLLAVSDVYEPPTNIVGNKAILLPFDQCVPAMMDIIQQDIFGRASEMKEAESSQKRVIREAVGVRSYHSLEIISRTVLFRPSLLVTNSSSIEVITSGVHALVTPFLHRLKDPEVDSRTIGKVKECMNKIVIGLSHNPSTSVEEVLPFVYATISPFLSIKDSNIDEEDNNSDSDSSDEEENTALKVSKTGSKQRGNNTVERARFTEKVFEWTPSQLKNSKDEKNAHKRKLEDKAKDRKVIDGANAPKLTGIGRYEILKSSPRGLSDLATSSAVSFGLSLLHSHLKRTKLHGKEYLADPFVKILTECVRRSIDTNAVLLSLKSLQFLLRMDLASVSICRKELGSLTLAILTTTGASSNAQDEMTQICFKTLALLIALDRKEAFEDVNSSLVCGTSNDLIINTENRKGRNSSSQSLPLNTVQMEVLVSILRAAVTDLEHYNSTFSVIKAITSMKYTSPGYYDLMDVILKISVQSHKPTVRQQAHQIFMMYFIGYPMGKERIENHLKQIILNIKYEYEDGRLSALGLVSVVIQKLPIPLLEEYTQLFFLPLILQLVNDESKKCRKTVADCISKLLKRISVQLLSSLYDYGIRWFDADGNDAQQLRRTSAQLFGIFVEARIDFMKRGSRIDELLSHLHKYLDMEIRCLDGNTVLLGKQWEMCYFCLQSLDKLNEQVPEITWKYTDVWKSCVKLLIHPHPWVQLTSSKIIQSHLSRLDPYKLVSKGGHSLTSFLVDVPGSLFEITRNLCYQLNAGEEKQIEIVSSLAIKNLAWSIQAMCGRPDLCFKVQESTLMSANDQELDESECQQKSTDPILWLMTRLSNIAKRPGSIRRNSIFKCFAAFATLCEATIITPYLELMLEALNRVAVERENSENIKSNENNDLPIADFPREVMQLLEDKCGTEEFVSAFTDVKSKARDKRDERKQTIAAEAVNDPVASAKRRIDKQVKEKQRKKRRIEERMNSRGVFKNR